MIIVFMALACARAEWISIPPPPADTTARDPVWSVVAHGGTLWALTPYDLFQSKDSGSSWHSARPPAFPRPANWGGRLLSAAGSLVATSSHGLFLSADDGATWKRSAFRQVPAGRVQGDSNVLLAGYTDTQLPFVSRDRGLTWKAVPPYFPDTMGLTAIYQDGNRIWASMGYLRYSDDGGRTWKVQDGEHMRGPILKRELGMLWSWGDWANFEASPDSGKTWLDRGVRVPEFLESFKALSLVSAGGKLFTSGYIASDFPGGVYISADTGKTWVPNRNGLPTYEQNDTTLTDAYSMLALGDILIALTGKGVYRSDDLGAHWRVSNSGFSASLVRNGCPAIQLIGNRFYAQGVINGRYYWYESADTARTWKTWNPGIPGVEHLEIGATSVFGYHSIDGGPPMALPIYQSRDGMKSWQILHGPWETDTNLIPLDLRASGSHIFVASGFATEFAKETGRFWHSATEGADWDTDSAFTYMDGIRLKAGIGRTLFRSAGYTVQASDDYGKTWRTSFNPFDDISALAVLDQRVLVLTRDSLFVSADLGRTWKPAAFGAVRHRVLGIAVIGSRALAATNRGLRISRNGQDWEAAGETGLSSWGLKALTAAGNTLIATTNQGTYASSDMGRHWVKGGKAPESVDWLASQKDRFYAAGMQGSVMQTVDSGITWKPVADQYTANRPSGFGAGPEALYLARPFSATVLRSTDGGAKWPKWITSPSIEMDFCTFVETDGEVIANQAEGAYAVSGSDWTKLELPGQGPHDFLAGHGKHTAISAGDGLYLRASKTSPWAPAEPGLPDKRFTALALDQGRVFAGLFGEGIRMSSEVPTSLAGLGKGKSLLAGAPAILASADGAALFRLHLLRPARVRLTLHS
ncbi:MAG: hypothetical protein ABIW76_03830, partial [Fibrobacteria bacterium]